MKYYLITDHTQDGDHEYYERVAVETSQPKDQWHENWENLYLCWQFRGVWIDEKNGDFWSDNRIVSVYETKEITKEEYVIFNNVLGGLGWSLDEILAEGKEHWDEMEVKNT